MNEHQVVVVFDVTAPDLVTAGSRVKDWLANDLRREDHRIESWWMPEEPLRSAVDGNDNAAGRLVFDAPLPEGVFVEDDADDEPTIWLHDPDEPDQPMALLCPGNLGRHGRELLWDYIVRELPTSAPDAREAPCPECKAGEVESVGRPEYETGHQPYACNAGCRYRG